uniref:Sulfotransferase family-containing protein n=1 Tax=Strongyloides venezuelensis TaxID=75913 RepID=A0A0K0F4G7_STRVS
MKKNYIYYFTLLIQLLWFLKVYASISLKEDDNKPLNGEINNIKEGSKYHDNHIVYKDIFSVVEDVLSANKTETDSKVEKIFKDIIFSVPMKETIQIYNQIKEKYKTSSNVTMKTKNFLKNKKKSNSIFNLTSPSPIHNSTTNTVTSSIINLTRKLNNKNTLTTMSSGVIRKNDSIMYKNETFRCFRTPFEKTKCIELFQLPNNNNYLVSKYKFHTCSIGKNFSAYITAIFCYLFNQKKFKLIYGHLENGIWNSFPCHNVNGPFSTREVIKDYTNKNEKEFWERWRHIVIIRNPIDRFISAFTHLCAKKDNKNRKKDCFNCNSNLKCFLERLYIDILRVKRKKKLVNNRVKNHFYPQTALCDYTGRNQFIRYLNFSTTKEIFYNSFIKELKDSNIPENDMFFIEKEIKERILKHTTTGTKLRETQREKLFNDPYLLDLATKIYYQDFVAFNYPLPNIVN